MGQGAGNACNHWVIRSDSMSKAYSSGTNRWIIPSLSNTAPIKQDMKAFIDDVNLFIRQPKNKMEE